MKSIENSGKRKNLFIKIILPLVLEENNRIIIDRKKLFTILNKNKNSKDEIKWLNQKFKQYGVVNKDLATLKVRMDIIPVSLAIAQAAKERLVGEHQDLLLRVMRCLVNGLGQEKVLNQLELIQMQLTKL